MCAQPAPITGLLWLVGFVFWVLGAGSYSYSGSGSGSYSGSGRWFWFCRIQCVGAVSTF